ncbi:MAG: M24 family metallopeptidase, partial [Verrucomicrobiia bacterium]
MSTQSRTAQIDGSVWSMVKALEEYLYIVGGALLGCCMAKPKSSSRRKASFPILMYADTRTSSDQLYLGKFGVPDAFISFKKGAKSYAVLSQLEFSRGLKVSAFDTILSLEEWMANARKHFRRSDVGIAEVIATLGKAYRMSGFRVSGDFPAWLAFELRDLGFEVKAAQGTIFPARETKSEEEILHLKEGNRCSAIGIRAADKALQASAIKRGYLYFDGKRLTSERLREIIEVACLMAGAVSLDTIAAGGDQACDPHCNGSGPIKANELIIVDVFPCVSKTGYHGDMTRTFLKGTPSDAQRALVAAVGGAQKQAVEQVTTGVNGKAIHTSIVNYFDERGYKTERTENGAVGFFHGTGHGLGLDVHEAPRISSVNYKLKRDSVVTVEPGLYYPGLGGCR